MLNTLLINVFIFRRNRRIL